MKESIRQLVELLDEYNIPYELTNDICGNKNNQIWYPNREIGTCGIICHEKSQGGKEGLLDMMGLVPWYVRSLGQGYLTPLKVFKRILRDYRKNKIEILKKI